MIALPRALAASPEVALDYEEESAKTAYIVPISLALGALAILTAFARPAGRKYRSVDASDICAFLAVGGLVTHTVMLCLLADWLREPLVDLLPRVLVGYRISFSLVPVYLATTWLIKMSACIMYLRLNQRIPCGRYYRRIVTVAAVMMTARPWSLIPAWIFQCLPIRYAFIPPEDRPPAPEARCINLKAYNIASNYMSILTDVILLALSIPIIYRICRGNSSKSTKAGLITLFSMGIFPCLCSMNRAALYCQEYDNQHFTGFSLMSLVFAAQLELAVSLIVVSLPSLNPLFVKFFRALRRLCCCCCSPSVHDNASDTVPLGGGLRAKCPFTGAHRGGMPGLWHEKTFAGREDEIVTRIYAELPPPPKKKTVRTMLSQLGSTTRATPDSDFGLRSVRNYVHQRVDTLESVPSLKDLTAAVLVTTELRQSSDGGCKRKAGVARERSAKKIKRFPRTQATFHDGVGDVQGLELEEFTRSETADSAKGFGGAGLLLCPAAARVDTPVHVAAANAAAGEHALASNESDPEAQRHSLMYLKPLISVEETKK